MTKKLKVIDPFKTLGGKSQLIVALLRVINYSIDEHNLTGALDLFMGGNRLFTHQRNDRIEFKLANEIDRGVIAFFRCLQDPNKTDQVFDTIQLLASHVAEKEFEAFKVVRLDEKTDEILSAALTYIVAEYSRAANRQKYCQQNVNEGIDIPNLKKRLYQGFDKIYEDVQFTCEDYEIPFHKYKHREDFIYLIDPPYLENKSDKPKKRRKFKNPEPTTKETDGYCHPFGIERHEKMVDDFLSDDFKAKVILCGYLNDVYKRLEDSGKFRRYYIGTVNVSSSSTGRKRHEYIWTNLDLTGDVLPFPDYDPEV